MFDHAYILMYLLGVGGIAYLFSRVGRKSRRRGKDSEPVALAAAEPGPEAVPQEVSATAAEPVTAPPDLPVFPSPEMVEVPIPGSDLRYYKPFGPADNLCDVWAKFQTFTSEEPITVRLIPTDNTAPLIRSSFHPDGTVHSSSEMFTQDFAGGIRTTSGPSLQRALRKLAAFGIPASSPEGAYHFYTGTVRMELRGVSIMGLEFSIRASFEPNIGLIARYWSHRAEYLHCEIPLQDASGKGRGQTVPVGFPCVLRRITLYTEDRRVEEESAALAKAILGKYPRQVQQERISVPSREDPARKLSLIADEMAVIAIHEGAGKRGRFLQIDYGPSPNGPLDEIANGDLEFVNFAQAVAEREKYSVPDEGNELILSTPF